MTEQTKPLTNWAISEKFNDLTYRDTLTTKDEKILKIEKEKGENGYRLLEGDALVFNMNDIVVQDGWITVGWVGPEESADQDGPGNKYLGVGIGATLYDVLDKHAHKIGAKGVRPDFGFMSLDSIRFWHKRLQSKHPELTDKFLETLLDIPEGSTDEPTSERLARIKASKEMFDELQKRR